MQAVNLISSGHRAICGQVRRIIEAGQDVIPMQGREVLEHTLETLARGKMGQNDVGGNPRAANDSFSSADLRV